MSFSEIPSQPRKAVGIDLGTTFSAIAHIDAYGKPQIIPNAESERITPSVILFDGHNAVVGSVAKQNAVAEPEKIVDFVKREMGKCKADFHREFDGKNYSAEELSALIIKKLKNDAEKYLGEPVTDAVITVPAYFNDAERTATLHAGQLAGLNFPNWTGFSGQVLNQGPDRDTNLVMIKAYNDWHVDEWCGAYPDRFIPCGI